jgi:RNA polymerase sigma-70 factor (ECF subfamily)
VPPAQPAWAYQIQAAINAVHSDARKPADTDWRQIVQVYDQLMTVAPGPVVALNRGVAVSCPSRSLTVFASTPVSSTSGRYVTEAMQSDCGQAGHIPDSSSEASTHDIAVIRRALGRAETRPRSVL